MPVPMTEPAPALTPLDALTWARLADRVGDWAHARGLPLRDAVWLLPFTALLPPLHLLRAASLKKNLQYSN